MESDVYLPRLSPRRPLGGPGSPLAVLLRLLLGLLLSGLLLLSVAVPGYTGGTARADTRTHVRLDPATSPAPSGSRHLAPSPESGERTSVPGSGSLPDTGSPAETLVALILAAVLIVAGGLAARALRRRR